jgi:hypothetical protein
MDFFNAHPQGDESVIDISAKTRMRVQDPLGSQTLMNSNAQLQPEG